MPDYTSIIKNNTLVEEIDDDTQAQMDQNEADRIRNYNEFWKLYRGFHWSEDELDEDKPTPIKNKCWVLVNKSISFLVGKPFTVNYPQEKVEELLAPYINVILENSGGKEKFGFEVAQMGSVTGDCFIKIVYDPSVPLGVRLQVMDSADVSVKYTFRDYQNEIPDQVEISWKFIDEQNDDKIRTYKEVWTPLQKAVYIDEELQKDESGINILGVVPIIHIRNMIIGKEVYGSSDIEQIEPLNKLLNSSLRRFMDDVEYHGDPITLLYGVRIGAMEKGEGKMWGNLPAKAKVENLILDTDFPAQQKMIEYMDEAVHEVGSIPLDSVKGLSAISNTSGIAIHMNYLTIIELTDRKTITYAKGLERALSLALRLMYIVEKKMKLMSQLPTGELEALGYKVRPKFVDSGLIGVVDEIAGIISKSKDPSVRLQEWNKVSVAFSDYLPKDKLTQMNLIREKLDLGLTSRKRALKELGEDNIEQILKEVDEDVAKQAESEMQSLYGSPSGTHAGSKDITEGMSIGTKVNGK